MVRGLSHPGALLPGFTCAGSSFLGRAETGASGRVSHGIDSASGTQAIRRSISRETKEKHRLMVGTN